MPGPGIKVKPKIKFSKPSLSKFEQENLQWHNKEWAKGKVEEERKRNNKQQLADVALQEKVSSAGRGYPTADYESIYKTKPKYVSTTPKGGVVRNDGLVVYRNNRVYDPKTDKKGSLTPSDLLLDGELESVKWDKTNKVYEDGTKGIKVKPKAASVGVVRNTQKQTVLDNLVADRTGRSSSNDAGKPRPEQQLMNESLQVPHPFEKGKMLGWGEFKGLAKTQASRFRDMGITDMAAYQQKAYNTALSSLEKFPEQAVDNYQNTRVAERTKTAIEGIDRKPSGRMVTNSVPTYKKGTKGIKVKAKK